MDHILNSIEKTGVFPSSDIFLYNRSPNKALDLANGKFSVAKSAKEVVSCSDMILLAVKPQNYDEVLTEIDMFTENKCIISIAAGVTVKYIKEHLGIIIMNNHS